MALFATTALWAADFQYDDLYYNITSESDKTVEVTYNSRYSSNYNWLTSATIPASVTYNGTTYSVTSIGDHAFQSCTGLTSVTIPNSVTSIEGSAFEGCTGLISISIPNSVTSIGSSAFSGCTGLTSITIPNSVTSIGSSAFSGCTGLTSATIENGVTYIGSYTFSGCTGLTSITIPNSVTSIGSSAFSGCTGLISVTIPNSVTGIGENTFSDCTGLTAITIGNSITSIERSAFNGCTSLTSVVWNAKSCKDFYENRVPFYDFRTQITSFLLGDSVEYFPAYICKGMEKLTSITIPNSVTTIGKYAFNGCSNLETVVFGENVQDIGDRAFSGCQNIYEMTVRATKVPNVTAESASSDYYGTFRGVSKLAELHVPAESVKKYKIHPVWGLFDVITAIPCVVTLHCDNVMGAVTGAGSYQANEQVNISASPNLGYRFRQWSDGITTNPRTLVVVGDTTLTAEFEEIPASEYTVSVVVDAEQNGAVQMVLTAVPDDGYQFTQWSDGNTDNPRTILVTENMTLRATFNLSTETAAAPANEDSNGTRKLVHNGYVLIQREGKTYTLTGVEM